MYFDLSIPSQLAGALLPDLVMMGGAMILLLYAVWGGEDPGRARTVGWLAILLTIATGVVIGWIWRRDASASTGMVAVDNFRWATDYVILFSTVVALTLALDAGIREGVVVAESYVLILFAASGMMLLAAARDLIVVFLGIELMSIAVYVLAGVDRRSPRAAEAALKYFLLGAFASAFLLYGIALIYGATGSTNLHFIGAKVSGSTIDNAILLIGIAFIMVGLGFKVAAVPFHMWTPDVYDGAPTPITAFMAAGVKAGAFAVFLRIWMESFPGAALVWHRPLWWIAVATMIVGNLIALGQTNIKRMLAYSSIAHAGYLLVAVVTNTMAGASAFIFYIFAYCLATMGAFGVVIALGESEQRGQSISDYDGLWQVRPWLAAAMTVFMLALLGFPIAGGMGFFGKWLIIQAALGAPAPQTTLAVVVVMASLISAGYYLGVVVAMFMKPRPADAPVARRIAPATSVVIGACALVLLFFGALPSVVVTFANRSAPNTAAGVAPVSAASVTLPR